MSKLLYAVIVGQDLNAPIIVNGLGVNAVQYNEATKLSQGVNGISHKVSLLIVTQTLEVINLIPKERIADVKGFSQSKIWNELNGDTITIDYADFSTIAFAVLASPSANELLPNGITINMNIGKSHLDIITPQTGATIDTKFVLNNNKFSFAKLDTAFKNSGILGYGKTTNVTTLSKEPIDNLKIDKIDGSKIKLNVGVINTLFCNANIDASGIEKNRYITTLPM